MHHRPNGTAHALAAAGTLAAVATLTGASMTPPAAAGVAVIDARAIEELSTIVVATARQLVELKKTREATDAIHAAIGPHEPTLEKKRSLAGAGTGDGLCEPDRSVAKTAEAAGGAREAVRKLVFQELTAELGDPDGTTGIDAADELVTRTFETHADAKQWLLEHYFVIEEAGDLIEGTEGPTGFLNPGVLARTRMVKERRVLLAQAAAVDAWALSAVAQNALPRFLEHEHCLTKQLVEARSLREELAIATMMVGSQTQAEIAEVVVLAARLELEALALLAQSPAHLTPRYGCALFGDTSGACP